MEVGESEESEETDVRWMVDRSDRETEYRWWRGNQIIERNKRNTQLRIGSDGCRVVIERVMG